MRHLLLLLPLVVACKDGGPPSGSPGETGAADTAPEAGAGCGDWSTVGQPLVLTYCTGCHASGLAGEARRGAPEGIDLETLSGVQAHRERVQVRAIEQQDMPQGGGLPEADRQRLAAWLACGAPGEEAPLPAMPGAEVSGLSFDDVEVTVSNVGMAERRVQRVLGDGRVLLEEEFLVDGSVVLFSGYDLRLQGAGRSRWFDRPIPLSPQDASATTWTAEVLAEVAEGTFEEQTWTLTRQDAPRVDGRSEDRAPVLITATSDAGEQHRWLLSETHVFSGRSLAVEGVSLELLRLDKYVPDLEDEVTPFPPEDGDAWRESAVWGVEVSPWWE